MPLAGPSSFRCASGAFPAPGRTPALCALHHPPPCIVTDLGCHRAAMLVANVRTHCAPQHAAYPRWGHSCGTSCDAQLLLCLAGGQHMADHAGHQLCHPSDLGQRAEQPGQQRGPGTLCRAGGLERSGLDGGIYNFVLPRSQASSCVAVGRMEASNPFTHRLYRAAVLGTEEQCGDLQLGWPGGALLTDVEQRAHFGLWAILKSPLIFGNDLR